MLWLVADRVVLRYCLGDRLRTSHDSLHCCRWKVPKCKNGTILCTAQLNVLLRWYTGNGRTNSHVLYMEWDFPKERAKHENYLLLFCIRFVPVHDLEDYYFDGTDGCQGFPRTSIAFYNKIYPLNKILCPRCKKTSNEVFVPKDKCPCFSIRLIDRAPVSLSARQPERQEIFRYPHPPRRIPASAFCYQTWQLLSLWISKDAQAKVFLMVWAERRPLRLRGSPSPVFPRAHPLPSPPRPPPTAVSAPNC